MKTHFLNPGLNELSFRLCFSNLIQISNFLKAMTSAPAQISTNHNTDLYDSATERKQMS